MAKGKITEYIEGEGGYIKPDEEEETFPFEVADLRKPEDKKALREGVRVLFQLEGGMAGISAKDIVVLN